MVALKNIFSIKLICTMHVVFNITPPNVGYITLYSPDISKDIITNFLQNQSFKDCYELRFIFYDT